VSFNRLDVLTQCLDALTAQAAGLDVEVIVVRDAGHQDTSDVKSRFSHVRWIDPPARATVPEMRQLGMRACQGDIVALLEDDCVVDPAWCLAVIEAHASDDAAIGGAVEPGRYGRALDWAVYFCEYGRFMLPLRPQANIALALAGDHVTYKRAALHETLSDLADGFIDMFVHTSWANARVPMRTEETLVVRNVNSWSLRHVTMVPYHHGRAFAGERFSGRSAWFRAVMTCLAPALPPLKIGRVVADAMSRKRYRWRLLYALPWIVVFMTSWSLGEAIGCASGPGASLSQWR